MDTPALLASVTERFAVTGAATPPWPDPHPERTAPPEEEYARCSTPQRYRILAARAEAWTQALTAAGLASAHRAACDAGLWRDGGEQVPETARWLRPRRSGALPLLFAFRSLQGVSDAVVAVGAGEPAVPVTAQPDCGCDACDYGSQDLLEAFDEAVLAVVTGGFVHVAARRWTVVATGPGERSSQNLPGGLDPERVLEKARSGRSRHRVVCGAAWA
ncbi:DUF6226 family protein [Streptomyces chumphonensis]|uniref:DUF6226 family protein n=1 Tax=Streptomyces chumphonensis TaxID=1214925 RepID=UPI003D73811E